MRARRVPIRASLASLTLMALVGPVRAAAQSGGFVATLGVDTVHIERFTRAAHRIDGLVVTRTPITLRHRYSMTFDRDGRPARYEFEIARANGSPLGMPGSAGSLTYRGDSVIRETLRDGRMDTTRIAAPVIPWPTPSVPYIGVSYLMYELAFADARRRAAAGTDLAIPLWTMIAGQKAPEQRPVWLVGSDSAEMSYFGVARSGYRFDAAGRLLRADWTGTTYHYQVRRVEAPDLETLARAWAEADGRGARMGPLSPRDTTRASVEGAEILVDYGRPARRGRAIWGALVPWDTVWRLGANFATHLTNTAALRVGGHDLPAGGYTLWMLPSPDGEARLIINGRTRIFGTAYDPAADVARVPLTRSLLAEPVERLTIAVEDGRLWIRWDDIGWWVPIVRAGQAPQGTTDSAAVLGAAHVWLDLLDRSRYGESFDSAAPLLRQLAGSVDGWRGFVAQARSGLNPPVERRLVESTANPPVAGAPPGRYWRMVFQAGGGPMETVVLQQADAGWRVAMYGVRGGERE